MPHIDLKICCIADLDEARLAARAGATAIGLVSAMPSGPGVIPEARIAEIAAGAPEGVETVLLTSLPDVESVVGQHGRCGTSAIQLCTPLAPRDLVRLRDQLPDVRLLHVVHVEDDRAVDEARAAAPHVDALLLDSGSRNTPVQQLGGTGRTHDWAVSRRIREAVPVPILLAGGLHAGNVARALAAVRPAGVDVCSGVRTDGRLDEDKLHAFVQAVRAFRDDGGGVV